MWFRINVVPIRDENCQVILLLLAFKDTTHMKQPLEGLGKFARLARSIAKNRGSMPGGMMNGPLNASLVKESNPGYATRDDAMKVLENLRPYKQEPPKTPPFIILHYRYVQIQ